MTDDPGATISTPVADGRPVGRLPNRELVRISLYWLGLSSIFAGLSYIMASRLEFAGLVDKAGAGRALFLVSISGAVIAVIVQPTIGSISDYTITRWGRRKPYIFIGSLLDLVFLVGIAYSNTLIAIAAFIALLQFSSNFAQGPFQGYVPDLVPARAGRDGERPRRDDAGPRRRLRIRHRRARGRIPSVRDRAHRARRPRSA